MKKHFFLIGLLVCAMVHPLCAQMLQSSITAVQPSCGLVLWPDNAEDRKATYGSAVTLEFQYALPCKVVTGKQNGVLQYNWKWLEDILNGVASRGHQAVLRWRYEYPSSKDVDGKTKGMTAVPAYIKGLSGYQETYSANPGGDGPTYYADWSNAELQWFNKQFFTDFAARYGSDPRIAFLEVGFGHWGEYHIYGTKLQLGKNFPSKAYQTDFFQHLDSVMPIPWLVSIDAADATYSPFLATPALMAMTFGNFDDSFMHRNHEIGSADGYNERYWRAIGSADNSANLTRWKRGVSGGEVSYYTDADQKNFLNPAGMYGHTWEEQAAKYHITFMIANDAPEGSYGTAARFRTAGMATGYRFKVTAVKAFADSTRIWVTNTGVAPIYRDAFFSIESARSTQSLRYLLPGDTLCCSVPAVLSTMQSPASSLQIVSDFILPSQHIQYEASCPIDVATSAEVVRDALLPRKLLRNGQVVLQRDGAYYSVLGVPMQ